MDQKIIRTVWLIKHKVGGKFTVFSTLDAFFDSFYDEVVFRLDGSDPVVKTDRRASMAYLNCSYTAADASTKRLDFVAYLTDVNSFNVLFTEYHNLQTQLR